MSERPLWFRHYTDCHRNLKLRSLPEKTQLFAMWMWELRKEGKYTPETTASDIAWHLRIDEARVRRELEALVNAGLIDTDKEIHNWSSRQYEGDGNVSTQRVKKHRERKQRNVSETFHVTPSDTDTEQIQNRYRADTDQKPVRVIPDFPNQVPPDLLALGEDFLPELAEPPQRPSWDQVRMLAGKAVALKTTLNAFLTSRGTRVLAKINVESVLRDMDRELMGNGNGDPRAVESAAAKAKRDERRALESACAGIFHDQGEDEARKWIAGRQVKYRTDLGLLVDSLASQAVAK